MANQRPITNLYSATLFHHRVSQPIADRVGHSVSVPSAIIAATRRIVTGEFSRCDIYNGFGAHIWQVVRHPKIGIAITPANIPASIKTLDTAKRIAAIKSDQAFQSWLTATRGKAH